MADVIFNSFKRDVMNGLIDLSGGTLKAALVTSAYTPDQDAHTKKSDITNEITGTGYTTGGKALTSVTIAADNTDNEGVLDAADMTWTSASFTARGTVIYQAKGGAASADPLVAYIDFGSNKTSTSPGSFVITWNSEGILNLN